MVKGVRVGFAKLEVARRFGDFVTRGVVDPAGGTIRDLTAVSGIYRPFVETVMDQQAAIARANSDAATARLYMAPVIDIASRFSSPDVTTRELTVPYNAQLKSSTVKFLYEGGVKAWLAGLGLESIGVAITPVVGPVGVGFVITGRVLSLAGVAATIASPVVNVAFTVTDPNYKEPRLFNIAMEEEVLRAATNQPGLWKDILTEARKQATSANERDFFGKMINSFGDYLALGSKGVVVKDGAAALRALGEKAQTRVVVADPANPNNWISFPPFTPKQDILNHLEANPSFELLSFPVDVQVPFPSTPDTAGILDPRAGTIVYATAMAESVKAWLCRPDAPLVNTARTKLYQAAVAPLFIALSRAQAVEQMFAQAGSLAFRERALVQNPFVRALLLRASPVGIYDIARFIESGMDRAAADHTIVPWAVGMLDTEASASAREFVSRWNTNQLTDSDRRFVSNLVRAVTNVDIDNPFADARMEQFLSGVLDATAVPSDSPELPAWFDVTAAASVPFERSSSGSDDDSWTRNFRMAFAAAQTARSERTEVGRSVDLFGDRAMRDMFLRHFGDEGSLIDKPDALANKRIAERNIFYANSRVIMLNVLARVGIDLEAMQQTLGKFVSNFWRIQIADGKPLFTLTDEFASVLLSNTKVELDAFLSDKLGMDAPTTDGLKITIPMPHQVVATLLAAWDTVQPRGALAPTESKAKFRWSVLRRSALNALPKELATRPDPVRRLIASVAAQFNDKELFDAVMAGKKPATVTKVLFRRLGAEDPSERELLVRQLWNDVPVEQFTLDPARDGPIVDEIVQTLGSNAENRAREVKQRLGLLKPDPAAEEEPTAARRNVPSATRRDDSDDDVNDELEAVEVYDDDFDKPPEKDPDATFATFVDPRITEGWTEEEWKNYLTRE